MARERIYSVNLRQSTVELLRKSQVSVAQEVVAQQVGQLNLTPSQSQACLRDANYNIEHIADAIELDSIPLFEGYLVWLRDVLAAYGVTDGSLTTHLRLLQRAYAMIGSAEQQQLIDTFIDHGLSAIEGKLAKPHSHILDCGQHIALAQKYLQAVLESRRDIAVRLVMDAVESGAIGVKELYQDVLTNVLYEIGRLWQERKISVAQEHYASAVTQYAITLAYDRVFVPSIKTRRMIGVCIGNELHEMGIRMVCDIFELSGWDTHYLGANVPAESIISEVGRINPHLVALSATLTSRIGLVRETTLALKARYPRLVVLVGGRAFGFDPSLWRYAGADGYGRDAAQAVELAERVVAPNV